MTARFRGCGTRIHYVAGDADPLFQTDRFATTQTDPARQLAEVQKKAGDLALRRRALEPTIQLLKNAVCIAGKPCPVFDQPWQVKQGKSGKVSIEGLSVMANMVENAAPRLERKPAAQPAGVGKHYPLRAD
ncbi:Uncharacterised protein [Raoultella terrigena]|uniref:Uncharacterized protein n=1 Tax=Raoultella terrigena TaxID=577 RepID=A0A4U9DFR0_RAOTE|nr:Uncharacterised protein [Raoultella terrigena]